MTSLFSLPESLSPRLKWIKRHQITLSPSDVADTASRWVASVAYQMSQGAGVTQDEALTDLAKKLGVRLWNEE